MNIGVFGTSMVGRTISAKLADLGHDVMIGTRDVAATLARAEPRSSGDASFAAWNAAHPTVTLGTFADAAAHGETVVNATNGDASLRVLELAGASNLDGKILIDVANPLDFAHGFPPALTVCNTDSLGEQIQRAYPGVKVVKTLHTVTASVMVNPAQVAGGDHTLFVCGDDEGAKAQVTAWLKEWFGWKDVIDLGDISNARATEMLLPLWTRLYGALNTGLFNFKVVR